MTRQSINRDAIRSRAFDGSRRTQPTKEGIERYRRDIMGEKKITDRCTGGCCEMFTIPYSPEEIWAAYHNWYHGGEKGSIRMNDAKRLPNPQDIHLIAPMLVHLGAFTETPVKKINPIDHQLLKRKFDPPIHYYRCKNFDSKARVCTIYEHRPVMCREYPNGNPCNYASCAWEEKRAKKQTPKERRERLRVLQEAETKKDEKGGGDVAPVEKPVDINETINVVALVNELNDKRRAELVAQLESMKVGPPKKKRGLGRGMAALIPAKTKKQRARDPRV